MIKPVPKNVLVEYYVTIFDGKNVQGHNKNRAYISSDTGLHIQGI